MGRTVGINNSLATYTGTWGGGSGMVGNPIQLEAPKNVGYATGTFGDMSGTGLPLTTSGSPAHYLKSGIDFAYNNKLNAVGGSDVDIYDDNASGAFTGGRYMRIVNNAKNITDVTGLNIQNVYAKQLVGISSAWASPPSTDVYIDPELGRFVLPRPLYWSRMESASDFTAPTIYSSNQAPTSYTAGSITGEYFDGTYAKFGSSEFLYLGIGGYPLAGSWTGYRNIYPLGNNNRNWNKGTISCWPVTYAYANAVPGFMPWSDVSGRVFFYFGSTNYVLCYTYYYYHDGLIGVTNYIQLVVNGASQGTWGGSGNGVVGHLYFMWDSAKSLSGGTSVRVFYNGAEVLNSTANLQDASSFQLVVQPMLDIVFSGNGSFTGDSRAGLDNIKVWQDIIEDAAWEYNGGSGREDALHYIYGAANGYKPQITGTNNGVGYHFISPATGAVTSAGSGGDETETLKASTTTYCAGTIGDGGALCDNVFSTLSSTTHYNYGKRLDASTTEDPIYGFGAVAGGIIDIQPSGALAANTYIRFVDTAINIKDANYPDTAYGGLKVFVKALMGTNKAIWQSPPKDRMYVDPISGNYLLPRPLYWSKVESYTNIISPEIYYEVYPPTTEESGSVDTSGTVAMKFNNGVYIQNAKVNAISEPGPFEAHGYRYIRPLGSNNYDWSKGTLSCWIKNYAYAVNSGLAATAVAQTITFPLRLNNGNLTVRVYGYQAHVNGVQTADSHYIELLVNTVSQGTFAITNNTLYHIYIVWDNAAGLSGAKTVRVFLNGVERLSSTTVPTGISNTQLMNYLDVYRYNLVSWIGSNATTQSTSSIDNIKIFDHVASEDPDWEYNTGTGREDAMHGIYGSMVDYKPNLAAALSGVGYFRSGVNARQCTITV